MSRALQPRPDLTILLRQLVLACESTGVHDALDSDLASAILEEAARFASAELEPLNALERDAAPSIVNANGEGARVRLSPCHIAAWKTFAEGGWLGLDTPAEIGGQGLPLVLALAVQEVFDRACPAFGMLGVSARSAVRLIAAHADEATRAEWIAPLLTGAWGATICISEVGAGSDVARIRTRAGRDAQGIWHIDGEKNWISYGDHDATARIGHCLLARTDAGLSLFLVPDTWDDMPNGVLVRRLEEKLGLHLSPTCALGFEKARGIMLGSEGRGLAQMFVMIANMRLSVGAMGLGIAAGACDVARTYARERLQGGKGPTPVAIENHPDVRRQLVALSARVEMMRGLLYRAAALAEFTRAELTRADLARSATESQEAETASLLVEWLLPIVKTLGGETAFAVASGAVQVLGGAGYTRDWPVEQALRDARVLTIFEGTTGIQAQDLVHRRLLRDGGRTLALFLDRARRSLPRCASDSRGKAAAVFDLLEATGRTMLDGSMDAPAIDAGATAFLALAAEAALAWIAAELAGADGDEPAARHLRAQAEAWLTGADARAALEARQVMDGAREVLAFTQA